MLPEDALEYPQEEILALSVTPLGLIDLKQFIQTLRAVDITLHLFIFFSELSIILANIPTLLLEISTVKPKHNVNHLQ